MSALTATIVGLGIVFFGMLSLAYKLNESEDQMYQYIGMLFIALAIAMLQVVGWAAVEIAENNGATYLSTGLATPVLWIVNITLYAFWLSIGAKSLWFLGKAIYDWTATKWGGQA